MGNAYWPQIGPTKLRCERFGNRLLFDGNNQAFSFPGYFLLRRYLFAIFTTSSITSVPHFRGLGPTLAPCIAGGSWHSVAVIVTNVLH
jgi:hypothetical protein